VVDVHTPAQRSRNMAAIKARNTKPEILVRRVVHSMGFRYGLHNRKLPGTPDLVLRRHKKVIFVHGCFWHCHQCSLGRVVAQTNAEFWARKRAGNAERDRRTKKDLERDGWRVLVLWECETKDRDKLCRKLERFLTSHA